MSQPPINPTPTIPDGANPNAAVYSRLHAACAALGCRLFTVSVSNAEGTLAARSYTSHPVEYPVSGIKPMTRDAWYDHVIVGKNSFVANSPEAFKEVFFDHALITALGLGSALNIPVIDGTRVLGTVNVLAEEQHFTPGRIAAYQAVTKADHGALVAAMKAGLPAT